MRPTLPLALSLALACAVPALAAGEDGWCRGPVCVQTCTAREEACVDPDACLAGDPGRLGECADLTTECLHVGRTCGPPP